MPALSRYRIFCLAGLLCAGMTIAAMADDIAPWSYDGDQDGQDMWGTLSPAYVACEIGKEQSPIIIADTQVADMSTLTFGYHPGKAYGRNSGRGALVSFGPGQTLLYDKTTYHLKHIMIHSPAEHVANGRAHAAELQFMHLSDAGQKLIVSVFVDPGNSPPPAMQKMISNIPKKPLAKDILFTMHPGLLIPEEKGYYTYMGSLTTPPCTEGVRWIIMKRKIGFTQDQFRQITALVGRNARLLQPAYFRTVKETRSID